MSLYEEAFLDDLRARLPVSQVVGRKLGLKKAGAEFKALSPFKRENTPSFTVNDGKKIWHDFSSGKGGDIFQWLVEGEGRTFKEAVELCADLAGVSLPDQPAGTKRTKTNGAAHGERLADRPDDGPPPDQTGDPGPGESGDGRDAGSASRREITKVYDYTDPQGSLNYQVCRIEWSENGKHKKTFIQRRPTPEGDGHWIWGLGAGEFVQARNGDWYQVTKERQAWSGKRRTVTEAVDHGLYRLVEFAELKSAGEPVFILEGEKDVDTARGWELVATTNSGGARHWRPEHAEMFRGMDVVVPVDNDDAGRERGELIAKSLRGIAARVRILDWAAVWADAPKGADLTDWRTLEEGTREQLFGIVAKLPAWQPEPFRSKFGLVLWGQHSRAGSGYEYAIEDLVPEREGVLIIGESQSGKSFFTIGMAMAGARGCEFFGHRVFKPFGVVYCAYEAGQGFESRMHAYEQYHAMSEKSRVPFAVLTKPIDLWSADINTDQLIDEILGVADSYFGDVGLGAVVIDTHNRAMSGASEIDSKEIGTVIARYARMRERINAGLWIVGHKNAAGKHRGNEQLYNNIETCIDVAVKTEEHDKKKIDVVDAANRTVRVARVVKQREGLNGEKWEFVLPAVSVGTNRYGKPRTSCVAVAPTLDPNSPPQPYQAGGQRYEGLSISAEHQTILNALKSAIEVEGVEPPPALKLPRAITRVVNAKVWKDEYLKVAPDKDTVKDDTINKRMKRASEKLQSLRVIGRINPYVWITGRAVRGIISARPGFAEPNGPEPPPIDEALDFSRLERVHD